ncbi:MAG: D-alanine--D-alanine ligase [Proteobacteria bacterium]|jgi:D-alanine-D-alanine ligase|nr:D-alanine--D-alanine ligase [Pseudomonadota bacterium]
MVMTDIEQNDFGKVAVLMGGRSGEREISLRSGNAVLAALVNAGVDAHGIDVDEHIFNRLQDEKFKHAFIALHGRGGEDGCIQGGLEMIGLPYTGSGVMASSICMDKIMTKKIWLAMGISTPRFSEIHDSTKFKDVANHLGLPFIVKPSCEGSSLGIAKITSEAEFVVACLKAHAFSGELMAEEWVQGGEYTVSVLDDEALPVIQLQTPHDFYDFEAKYKSNDTQYLLPCGLEEMAEVQLQVQALQAFRATNATSWGRVDVILDDQGKSWFLEVNTVPGMTDHSLVPMAAKHIGIDFQQLVLRILAASRTCYEVA